MSLGGESQRSLTQNKIGIKGGIRKLLRSETARVQHNEITQGIWYFLTHVFNKVFEKSHRKKSTVSLHVLTKSNRCTHLLKISTLIPHSHTPQKVIISHR